MNSIKTVKGLSWAHMAISNSEWTGVKLRDVLAYAGFNPENNDAVRHIQFEGIDRDMVTNYGSSIPIHTVCYTCMSRHIFCWLVWREFVRCCQLRLS